MGATVFAPIVPENAGSGSLYTRAFCDAFAEFCGLLSSSQVRRKVVDVVGIVPLALSRSEGLGWRDVSIMRPSPSTTAQPQEHGSPDDKMNSPHNGALVS